MFLYCFKSFFSVSTFFLQIKFLSTFVVILIYHHEIAIQKHSMAIHLRSANSFAAFAANLILFINGLGMKPSWRPDVLNHWRNRGGGFGYSRTSLSPPPLQYYITDASKAIRLLWFHNVTCYYASVYIV